MKKIGMIGGLAWPSTLDYYRLICSRTNARAHAEGVGEPLPTPPMVIESVNIHQTRQLRGEGDDAESWEPYESFFRSCIARLEGAGAEIAFIASNTPHMRFPGIVRDASIPVVSIVDATAQSASRLNAERVLILGTPVTMRSSVYPEALTQTGVQPVLVEDDEIVAKLAALIDNELYRGDVEPARDWMLDLCTRYAKNHQVDTVCLACTELPLAFPDHADDAVFEIDGIRYVNTTVAHADAVLDAALSS